MEGFECQAWKFRFHLVSHQEFDESCTYRKCRCPWLAGGDMGLNEGKGSGDEEKGQRER